MEPLRVKISTKQKVVTEVWNTLNEMGIEGILTGQAVKIGMNELLNHLIRDGKAYQLCQVIADLPESEVADMEIEEVSAILAAFFVRSFGALQSVPGMTMDLVNAESGMQNAE